MIDFTLSELLGVDDEDDALHPEADEAYRARLASVAKGDDIEAAKTATGHALDVIGMKYGMIRLYDLDHE